MSIFTRRTDSRVPIPVPYIVISFIILFYAINNFIYLKMGTQVSVDFHESFRLFKFLKYYKNIDSFNDWARAFRWAPHGPLYNSLAMLPKFFDNLNFFSVRMLNIFWFSVLVVSLYELGRRLFNSRTGIYSVIIVSLYPVVFADSRLFKQSFGVMGMIVLALIFLFGSRGFKDLKSSLLFGLLFGMSLIVRKTAIIFLIGPVIFTLWEGMRGKGDRKTVLVNFIYANLIFLAIVGYRYFNPAELPYLAALPFEDPVNKFSFEQLSISTLGIVTYQLSLPFFLIFIWAITVFLKRDKRPIVKALLLSWILVPLLFFMLIPHSNEIKNTLPYVPAFALISGFGLSRIIKSFTRKISLSVIIILGLMQYYSFSFGIGIPFYRWEARVLDKRINYFYHNDSQNANCSSHGIYKEDIFLRVSDRISEETEEGNGRNLLMFCSEKYNIRPWAVFYWMNDFPFEVFIFESPDATGFISEFKKALRQSDFIFVPADENSAYIDAEIEAEMKKFSRMDYFKDAHDRVYYLLKRRR